MTSGKINSLTCCYNNDNYIKPPISDFCVNKPIRKTKCDAHVVS